ncbi:hypothetical protein LTR94_035771, partial [Friedmanniomyces endolithicus]
PGFGQQHHQGRCSQAGRWRVRRDRRCCREGRRSFAQRLRQVQGQGHARPRRPQPFDRCDHPDRCRQEADLHPRQGGQGQAERL